MTDIDVEPVEDADAEAGTDAGTEREEADSDPAGAPAGGPPGGGAEPETTEIPVDAAGTDAPEYVLYGGKGGVGKTTMAAATGLASAADGTRTLVVSTDPAHSLSDAYGTDVPAEPTRIHPEIPLYGTEIDPDAAVEEAALFAEDGSGPLGRVGELLGEEGSPLGGAMPGADEAAAMQQLLQLLDDDRFDRVVVDTAPTGHTLRLLELPELMDTMVGRMVTFRERMSGMLDGLTGVFGESEATEDEDLDDLQAVRERIERLRAILRDPARTDFRVVMVPEEMSVVESERLLERLAEFDIPAGTVVVNRVMEDLVDVVDDLDAAAEFVGPDLENCAFCQRRWSVQQDALRRAQDVFRGHDVKRVPLFADEVRGEAKLRIVARCLA